MTNCEHWPGSWWIRSLWTFQSRFGAGTGAGIWQASGGKLCEARNPTSFPPKGTPSTCNKISSDGSRFTVGSIPLIPI
jgi:hypothetical protein